MDVAVQPDQRLAFGLDVAHRGAADRLVLDLAQHRLDPEVVVEGGRVVQLGRIRRRVQVDHGAFGAFESVRHGGVRGGQLLLVLFAVGVPGCGVGIAPADHLVLVVQLHDLALGVDAPRRPVQHLGELRRVVVAEHQVERHALRPQPRVGDVQPLREPVAHEPEEQVIEGSVGLHGLQLAGLGAVGVIAVVGDEPFQLGELGALGQLVAVADEGAVPPPVRPLDDRLDRLARHVPAGTGAAALDAPAGR